MDEQAIDQMIRDGIERWHSPSVIPIVHSRPLTDQERHALFHEIKRMFSTIRAQLAALTRERDEARAIVLAELKELAVSLYVRGSAIYREDACLGSDAKIAAGTFGHRELRRLMDGAECFGAHDAIMKFVIAAAKEVGRG